jgi:hypothetical protein
MPIKKKNPTPPKGTTLKASAARYSETRKQASKRFADKYEDSDLNDDGYRKYDRGSYAASIRDDDDQRQRGLKSKDKGMVGMSGRDPITGRDTRYGMESTKAIKALGKVGEASKAKAASKKKPMSTEVYAAGMAKKASQPKGQTLKATPVKAKSGPSSVKAPTKPTAKKKGR